jgi:hypothetical protein
VRDLPIAPKLVNPGAVRTGGSFVSLNCTLMVLVPPPW